jgi:hypothetical protein
MEAGVVAGHPGSHPLWKGLDETGATLKTSGDGVGGKKGLPSQSGFGSLVDGSKN